MSFGLGQFGVCYRSSPGEVEDSVRHSDQKDWKDCGRHRRSSFHFPHRGRFQAFDALSKNLACNSICNFSVARWWHCWRRRYGLVSQVLHHQRETCAHDLTLAAFVDGQSAFCRPPACVVTEALLKIPGVGDYNIRAINAVLSLY